MNTTLEAEFHRRVKGLLNKRMQGYVMGAFRDAVASADEADADEESAEAGWRRLALQFDEHRLQALWHLKAMLQDPEKHRPIVEAFLAAGPLSGEAVLAERIKAAAEAQLLARAS